MIRICYLCAQDAADRFDEAAHTKEPAEGKPNGVSRVEKR